MRSGPDVGEKGACGFRHDGRECNHGQHEPGDEREEVAVVDADEARRAWIVRHCAGLPAKMRMPDQPAGAREDHRADQRRDKRQQSDRDAGDVETSEERSPAWRLRVSAVKVSWSTFCSTMERPKVRRSGVNAPCQRHG